jgi:hypothetical protein
MTPFTILVLIRRLAPCGLPPYGLAERRTRRLFSCHTGTTLIRHVVVSADHRSRRSSSRIRSRAAVYDTLVWHNAVHDDVTFSVPLFTMSSPGTPPFMILSFGTTSQRSSLFVFRVLAVCEVVTRCPLCMSLHGPCFLPSLHALVPVLRSCLHSKYRSALLSPM